MLNEKNALYEAAVARSAKARADYDAQTDLIAKEIVAGGDPTPMQKRHVALRHDAEFAEMAVTVTLPGKNEEDQQNLLEALAAANEREIANGAEVHRRTLALKEQLAAYFAAEKDLTNFKNTRTSGAYSARVAYDHHVKQHGNLLGGAL